MLRKLLSAKPKGFTLIEIVIVLAIAGLIFVIVFFAVTQAQIGRRDTQRKNDANRFMAAVAQWSSNKSGDVPSGDSEVGEVVSKYLNDFNDPSEGVAYVVKAQTGAPSAVGEMSYDDGSQCNATNDGFSDGSGRDYALLTRLEKNGVVVCVDSGG